MGSTCLAALGRKQSTWLLGSSFARERLFYVSKLS